MMRITYAHMNAVTRSRRKSSPPAKPAKQVRTRSARKTPTNLSLRIDLVERAKALGLNLSEVVESSLEKAIIAEEQARWLAENEKAIEYYNSVVEKWGLFGEEFRQF
jgi:antitoxin CcdA